MPLATLCLLGFSKALLAAQLVQARPATIVSQPANKTDGRSAKAGVVHIQFVDKPAFNGHLTTKTNTGRGKLEYVEFYDQLDGESVRFDEVAKTKKATYSTQSDWIVVRRSRGFFDYDDWLVHQGDSLVMSFDLSKPLVIKSSGATYAPLDLTVEALLNAKYPGAYSTVGKANDTRSAAFKAFFDDPRERERQQLRKGPQKGLYLEELENKVAGELLASMKALQLTSQSLLDSLRASQRISEPVYRFYTHKYAQLPLKLAIMAGSIDSTQAANQLNARLNAPGSQTVYFHQCLETYEKKFISSRVRWTQSEYLHLRDPKESFTLAQTSSLLAPAVKESLLWLSLGKIALYFPHEVGPYLQRFVRSVKDPHLVEKAQAEFQKERVTHAMPSALHLSTLDKRQLTFEQFLQQKKGNVLYVDFWASWCVPCMEEMPSSRRLAEFYRNKGLEVVFVSLDDSYVNWSKAAERLGVASGMNSFRVLEAARSSFLREHNVRSIPRYLVINQQGQVINAQPPRPSDPKILEFVDEWLAK